MTRSADYLAGWAEAKQAAAALRCEWCRDNVPFNDFGWHILDAERGYIQNCLARPIRALEPSSVPGGAKK